MNLGVACRAKFFEQPPSVDGAARPGNSHHQANGVICHSPNLTNPAHSAGGAHEIIRNSRPAASCAIQINKEMPHQQDDWKRSAAESAVTQVSTGMIVGLGTGSTAEFVLLALARRIREGLRITGVPTSEHTVARAGELGIPLTELDGRGPIDIAIDGADEVERGSLNLIKGGGGALTREKIVAQAATRFLIVVDQTKMVDRLGAATVPVEVVPFGWQATARRIETLGAKLQRRDFVTDNGNYVLDCTFGPIDSPKSLADALDHIAGVVEHGVFICMAAEVHVGGPSGVQVMIPNG